MAKSSINFAKATAHSHAHNFREDQPSYLLPEEHRLPNEFWQNELKLSAKEIFDREVAQAKPKGGRKPSFESSHWEAVLNFNRHHSIEDVRRVAEHIERKFNVKCVEIAMHKDEGHLDDYGDPEYNLHAHLNFVTYKDGKQNWRRELITPEKLSELQTEVAELMGMERGDPDRKAKRLEHRELKIVKQIEGDKDEQIRSLIKRAETAEKLLKTAQATIEAQKHEIERLKADLSDLKAMYDEDRAKLKASGTATQSDYQALKKAHDDLKAEIKGAAAKNGFPSIDSKAQVRLLSTKIDFLKEENGHLKSELAKTPERDDQPRPKYSGPTLTRR